MSGLLARRVCCNGSSALLEQLSASPEALLAQALWWERCSSGVGASTSGIGSGSASWPAAHGTGAIRRHTCSATNTPANGAAPLASTTSAGWAAPYPASGLRGFAAVAAAEAAPAAAAAAPASSSPGGATSAGVPWPWVDPSRPQVLPVAAVRPSRATLSLDAALQQLLGRLSPGQASQHSLEVFVRFALDPRRSDHLVRGSVVLPYGTGKRVRIVVFAKGADAEAAREQGVDLIGDDELISSIVSSEPGADLGFDKLIATPDFMKPLARAGRVLGPKGLMPNPKMGTLTTDIAKAVSEIRRGRLDYRLGRDSAVRAAVGRASMPSHQLAAHVGGLVASLLENKPKALGGPVGAPEGGAAAAAGGKDAAAGGTEGPAAGAGPAELAAGLQGYVKTFLLKTTRSAPVAVTFDSLAEAALRYRALTGEAAGAAAAKQ